MAYQMTKKLNNGVEIPLIGLGVWQSQGKEGIDAVRWALETGYRHIDTAAIYENEEQVAQGIKESGVSREDIFITTKLWNQAQRDDKQMEAIEESLKRLDTDYVDLLLIHWPVPGKYTETWRVLEQAYKQGKARAVGVSNFHPHHMTDIIKMETIIPAVNQVELHPYLSQKPLVNYCESLGITMEPWSPLGGTGGRLLQDERLAGLAEKYGKTPAQIILRWDIQQGFVVIPKSVHKEYIESNARVFDFELSEEDMRFIDAMNKDERMVAVMDPDDFDF